MKDIYKLYEQYCESKDIPFQLDTNVRPYDDTTLFCPAGMQQFKDRFRETDGQTIANIQSCLRLKDLDEIGDGTHLLYFNMIGLFSFDGISLKEAIDFWMDFVVNVLEVEVDVITLHSAKFDEWKCLYDDYGVTLKVDDDCRWTDGEIGGFCTEFYHQGVEIGNIVNPLGTSIDVGFGMERLETIVNGDKKYSPEEILQSTILKIIESGYWPGPQKQGYVLRSLLRRLYKLGGTLDHPFFEKEVERQRKAVERYDRLKDKHQSRSREWWYETHGINIDEMDEDDNADSMLDKGE